MNQVTRLEKLIKRSTDENETARLKEHLKAAKETLPKTKAKK